MKNIEKSFFYIQYISKVIISKMLVLEWKEIYTKNTLIIEQARIKTLLKRDTEKMLINIGKATKK